MGHVLRNPRSVSKSRGMRHRGRNRSDSGRNASSIQRFSGHHDQQDCRLEAVGDRLERHTANWFSPQSESHEMAEANEPIPALVPRDETGFQFVCYADSCSGVPGAPHEGSFAAVNAVVARLRPQPEFICFPGDEIRGLTADTETLRQQWDYWFGREMAWLNRKSIPLYNII